MTRAPCGSDEKADHGLKKGPWTPDEDQKLVAYIQKHGHGSWRSLPLNAGLQRCGKSCRLRWTNYLRPDINRGRFSHDEDQMIVHLHAILGNRWSAIASHLPRRTDNEIKNHWNTHLKKRLLQMGIDPVTHESIVPDSSIDIIPGLRPVVSSNLTHMSQWDSFRAEAEARLYRSLQSSSNSELLGPPATNIRNQGVTSTTAAVMSKWLKAQTLRRPSFGFVEPDDKTTPIVNFHTYLQDWESSPALQGRSSPSIFSAYGSPIEAPDFSSANSSLIEAPDLISAYGSPIEAPDLSSSSTPSGGALSPKYDPHAQVCLPDFHTSAEITEALLQCRNSVPEPSIYSVESTSNSSSSSFKFTAGMCCGDSSESERAFSPTSTLHDHDSLASYTNNSPCMSNFDLPQSFWSRPQVAMTDPWPAGWSFDGDAMLSPGLDMANHICVSQFHSSM